ncbi:hypothetical protein Tco_1284247, partial [Tanacetum coccineum]
MGLGGQINFVAVPLDVEEQSNTLFLILFHLLSALIDILSFLESLMEGYTKLKKVIIKEACEETRLELRLCPPGDDFYSNGSPK